ncbi:hypothetical protein RRG08_014137 [Elysia crispata]|uniref:Uncharacterized protein n=1 Tax=Elysia crispata TaxID=231223 RepID=A0AAE1AGR2_9GAST|nr:hypothetical protein RRG08_014137 [Elysia crispata]
MDRTEEVAKLGKKHLSSARFILNRNKTKSHGVCVRQFHPSFYGCSTLSVRFILNQNKTKSHAVCETVSPILLRMFYTIRQTKSHAVCETVSPILLRKVLHKHVRPVVPEIVQEKVKKSFKKAHQGLALTQSTSFKNLIFLKFDLRMECTKIYLLVVLTVCLVYLTGLTDGQTVGGGGGGGTGASANTNLCSSRFEADLAPQCFEPYGVNFTGVIFVLSGNRTGAIPAGYTFQTFLEFLCSVQMQDNVIPCVLKLMQKYNGTQCTAEDRQGVLGRGGQLLAFVDAICGAPCEQEATQSLIQCYAAINVNPEPILNPNASISDDKFVVVGTNQTDYDNFCNNRQSLFSCLGPLSSTCPGLLERLYTIGVDLEAMEGATDILCTDRAQYFEALQCFSKQAPAVSRCSATTQVNMKTVMSGRYQTGQVPPSQYMDKLCEAKLTQVDCELQGWGQTCSPQIAELRTAVECASLPRPCREGAQFSPVYNGICQKVTTPSPASTVRPTVPPGGPGEVPSPPGRVNTNQGQGGNNEAATGIASLALPLITVLALTVV